MKHLVRKILFWDRINALHLDEYIELPKDSLQHFTHYLKEHILNKVNLKRCFLMEFDGSNTESEVLRYEKIMKNNKPDIAFICIGENGHIAFNSPSNTSFTDEK